MSHFPYMSKDELVQQGFPAYAGGDRILPTWQRYHGLQGGGHAMSSGQFRGSIGGGMDGLGAVWDPPFDQRAALQGQALAMGMARGGSSYEMAGLAGSRMAGFRGLAGKAGDRACSITGGLLNFAGDMAELFGGSGTAETSADKQRRSRSETASGALHAGGGLTDTICDAVDSSDPAATDDTSFNAAFGAGSSPAPRTEEAGLSTNTMLLGAVGLVGVIALVAFLKK